ncbi:MAG: hypothetical protein ACI4XL_05560 [Bacillus sp. (in: firmicutes)]
MYKKFTKQHYDMRCEFHIDQEKKIVHILDTNEKGTTPLTEGIELFVDEMERDIRFPLGEYEVICYSREGVPVIYKNPGFSQAVPEQLYKPFQESISETAAGLSVWGEMFSGLKKRKSKK